MITWRERAAVAVLVAGASGVLAYGLVRAFVYARGGGGALALLLRQQTTAYYQVLGVAAFATVASGLGAFSVVRRPTEVLEKRLSIGLVSAYALSVIFDFAFP